MCLISDVSPENIAISTGVYILYDSQKKTDFHLKCQTFLLHSGQIWLLKVTLFSFYRNYTNEIWQQF